MSDLSFDLNISHYTIKELEELIKLSSPYNFKQIQLQALLLKKQIFNIISLGQTKKLELHLFIKDLIDTLERNYIALHLNKLIEKQQCMDEKIDKIINMFEQQFQV